MAQSAPQSRASACLPLVSQAVVALLATRSASESDSAVQGRAEFMLRRGFQGPLVESLLTFYQDYENIKEGEPAWARGRSGAGRGPGQYVQPPSGRARGWRQSLGERPPTDPPVLEVLLVGKYGLPWDMTTPQHRQFNPLFMLRRGAAFVQEAADTLRRR